MARPKNEHETWPARFPVGTKARLDPLLEPGETRADFVRTAVDKEITRRTRKGA